MTFFGVSILMRILKKLEIFPIICHLSVSCFKSIWHLLLYPEQQTISRYLLKLIADRINLIIVLASLNYLPFNISGSFWYFLGLLCKKRINSKHFSSWNNLAQHTARVKIILPFYRMWYPLAMLRKDEVKLIFNILIEIH